MLRDQNETFLPDAGWAAEMVECDPADVQQSKRRDRPALNQNKFIA